MTNEEMRAIAQEAANILGSDEHYVLEDEVDESWNDPNQPVPNGWYVTARVYVPNQDYDPDRDEAETDEDGLVECCSERMTPGAFLAHNERHGA